MLKAKDIEASLYLPRGQSHNRQSVPQGIAKSMHHFAKLDSLYELSD
jgi:hypothetical protein